MSDMELTLQEKRFYTICGWVLAISEIWKQIYLTHINGYYMWWHFPFQICSLPIYFCLMLPSVKKHLPELMCYMATFCMVGGCAGLIGSTALSYPRLSLVLHSYLWHLLLIGIGWESGHIWMRERRNQKDFLGATVIYGLCAVIAFLINMAVTSLVSTHAGINLFYLNPNVEIDVVVFRRFIPMVGNVGAIIIFQLAFVAFSFMTMRIWMRCVHHVESKQRDSSLVKSHK